MDGFLTFWYPLIVYIEAFEGHILNAIDQIGVLDLRALPGIHLQIYSGVLPPKMF